METAAGALINYITSPDRESFQPMNISFGLIKSYLSVPRGKSQSKEAKRLGASRASLQKMREFVSGLSCAE